MRIRAILTRETPAGGDQASGTFQGEADALLWAVNMVGNFNPVKQIERFDGDKLIEYTFRDKDDKEVGFATFQ
jgi:hypothetical protein